MRVKLNVQRILNVVKLSDCDNQHSLRIYEDVATVFHPRSCASLTTMRPIEHCSYAVSVAYGLDEKWANYANGAVVTMVSTVSGLLPGIG